MRTRRPLKPLATLFVNSGGGEMRLPRMLRVLLGRPGPHRAEVDRASAEAERATEEALAQSAACASASRVARLHLSIAIARHNEAVRKLMGDTVNQPQRERRP